MKQALAILTGIFILVAAAMSFAADCGDVNSDTHINVGDAVYLINYIFKAGPPPILPATSDCNNDGKVNVGDVVYLINYIFKGGPSPQCPSFYTAAAITTIIPPESSAVILGYDSSGTIALGNSSVYANREVGDIIIGRDSEIAPNGFLRKVTAKSVAGDTVILATEAASMTEAFQSMYISDSNQLAPSNIRSTEMVNGSRLVPSKSGDMFDIVFNCIFYDQDGDTSTTDDQIRLHGEYKFTATLFTKIEISWFSLKKFETGIKTTENSNVNLTANLHWDFDREVSKDLSEIHMNPIPIGSVVWIVPTFTVRAHIHGDLTVTFETGITYSQQLRYGFGYANNAFYDINESRENFNYTPPQLTTEFNFEPSVSLETNCLLYGVAGPFIGGKTGLHFQSVLNADPCVADLTFSLNGVLYAVVGIHSALLGLDYSKDFQLYSLPIGQWVYHVGGLGTIVVDPEPISLNAPWSLVGPCGYSTSGSGPVTLNDLNAGDYTITWGDRYCWTKPSNSTKTLVGGHTLTFQGIYVEITLPVLTTTAISSITHTTAQSGGNISSDGGGHINARGICWSIYHWPTILDNITTDGAGTGSFTSALSGLTANTTYYVRAYATNCAGTAYGNQRLFITLLPSGTVTDIDGNTYQTVQIGGQWWMAENLRVTHYRNGDAIPIVTDGDEWIDLTIGAYCNYENDPDVVAVFGRLYNWYAVQDSRNIAPMGWHVPSDAELKQLEMYLGMSQSDADQTDWRGTGEGGKLKEAGTVDWYDPNTGATNASGFTARPGSFRGTDGNLYSLGYYAVFWSSTAGSSDAAWGRYMYYLESGVNRNNFYTIQGFSVRCVKD